MEVTGVVRRLACRIAQAVLLVCLTTMVAWAKPKLALPAFDGDSGKIRDGVAEALDGPDFEVVSKRDTKRAADKVGELAELSDKEARDLAFDLGADVLVLGAVTKKDGKTVLKVKLYVDGKKAKGFSIQFRSATSPDFQKALRATLKKKVAAASDAGGEDEAEDEDADEDEGHGEAAAGGEDAEDPIDNGKKKKKKVASDEDADEDEDEDADEDSGKKKKKKKKKQQQSDDDEDSDEDEDESSDEEDSESSLEARLSPHQANRAAIRLDLGASAASRSLRFTSRSDFPEAPRDYKNSVVPGGRIELELYPLAFKNPRSIAAGLGLAVEYDKTFALNLATTAEPGVAVPTKQQHYSAGARFRLVLGKRPTSPGLTFGVSYGRRSFIPNRSPLMDPAALDLPDTDYRFIAPSLALRVPVVRAVAVLLGGEGMLVNNAGQIQTAASYGKAKIVGFEAFGGLDIVITSRIAVRLVGEFTQIGYAFVGTGGMMTNNRDGDPTTKDIGGAEDRSIGGALTIAVLY